MPSSPVDARPTQWAAQLSQLPVFRQLVGLFWLSLYIVTLLALLSYDPADLSSDVFPPNPVPSNFIGYLGAEVAANLFRSFGFGAYFFPIIFVWCCVVSFLGFNLRWRWKALWVVLFVASGCCLLSIQHFFGWKQIETIANFDNPGGILGQELVGQTVVFLGGVGTAGTFAALFAGSGILLFDLNPIANFLNAFSVYREWRVRREEQRLERASPEEKLDVQKQRIARQIAELQKTAAAESARPAPGPVSKIRRMDEREDEAPLPESVVPTPRATPLPDAALVPGPEPEAEAIHESRATAPVVRLPREQVNPGARLAPVSKLAAPEPSYLLPRLDLLAAPVKINRDGQLDDQILHQNQILILKTLRVFGVEATPGDITPGATITRYEVKPAEGVRVDKISSLGRDLARVLCAERINILAPIPGKDTVGIEVPNSNKVAVFLRELLESRDWHGTQARIPIALGKDVYGKTLVADLAGMPHLLIGGTTGSGKSVCINCIILSFLFRFSPDEMRLILIDPKQVEMQVYNAIPHLVVPVVTDPKKVLKALNWVIREMENRYRILAKVGLRNIASFNARVVGPPMAPAAPSAQLELKSVVGPDDDDEPLEEEDDDEAQAPVAPPIRVPRDDDLVIPPKLPYIVVIVDELADLMQTAPADVESAVARLTAKARAAGIHLIVATQTPRREVITGVIKTNIPARIAFQVPSGLDSRVILDENGAENLLGRGDLLYRPPGVGRLTRGQGAFVSDEEVSAVVKFTGDQVKAAFIPEIHAKLTSEAPELTPKDQELVRQAFDVIRHEKKASTSHIQRIMRLGYNKAAFAMDYFEKTGVVGPGDGAKPREILVDLDTYELNF